MLPAFDSIKTTERLSSLDWKARLAFGASCGDRLIPNYKSFSQAVALDDQGVLESVSDFLWELVAGAEYSEKERMRLTSACEAVAPSSSDHKHLLVTAAQDACFALCNVMDYVREPRIEHIVQAASYAVDSVDLYVQEIENLNPDDPDLELKIVRHPLMQQELRNQQRTFLLLESSDELNYESSDELRRTLVPGTSGNLQLA